MTTSSVMSILTLVELLWVLIGIVASALLIVEVPTLRTVLLLLLAIWGFCRAYCSRLCD